MQSTISISILLCKEQSLICITCLEISVREIVPRLTPYYYLTHTYRYLASVFLSHTDSPQSGPYFNCVLCSNIYQNQYHCTSHSYLSSNHRQVPLIIHHHPPLIPSLYIHSSTPLFSGFQTFLTRPSPNPYTIRS